MRRFTVQQLEAFAAISACGSFRIAAERLGVTQPSISLRIRELEGALGQRLFLRGKGGVRLSEAGQVMQDYVHRSLAILDEMAMRLQSDDPLSGVLRLGSSNTFALSGLPAVIEALEKEHPRLQIEVMISNSHSLYSLLHERKLDVAFLLNIPPTAQIEVEPLAHSQIAWFGTDALRSSITRPKELLSQRIITLPPPSPFHTIIVDWFARAQLPLPTLSTCNDMATMVRLVRMGIAISVLPLNIVDSEMMTNGRLRLRHAPPLPLLDLCAAFQRSLSGRSSSLILRIAREAIHRAETGLQPTAVADSLHYSLAVESHDTG